MSDFTVFATGGGDTGGPKLTDGSTNTDFSTQTTTNDSTSYSNVTGGVSWEGMLVNVQLKKYTVAGSTLDEKKVNLAAAIGADVAAGSSGSTVLNGNSLGDMQYIVWWNDTSTINVTPQNGSPSGTAIEGLMRSMVGSGLSSYASIANYYAALREVNPTAYDVTYSFINDSDAHDCYVFLFNIGMVEYHNSTGTLETFTPAMLIESASFSTAWSTGFSDYSQFCSTAHPNSYPNCAVKAQNGATDQIQHLYCQVWYGTNRPHKTSSYGWHGYSALAQSNYIVLDSSGSVNKSGTQNYYGRQYWSPFSEFNITVSSGYGFFVTADPQNQKTLFDDGVSQTGRYSFCMVADDATKATVKASIGTSVKYTVTMKLSPYTSSGASIEMSGTSKFQNWGASITLPVSRTSVPNPYQTTSTVILQLTPSEFYSFLNTEWCCTILYTVPDNSSATYEQCTLKPTVTVKVGSTTKSASPVANSSAAGWDSSVPSAYTSWTTGTAQHEEWAWSTSSDNSAYAEIVANCVGTKSGTIDGLASDWSVGEGIPSTENVSVAAGGRTFDIDLGGRIHVFNNQSTTNTSTATNIASDATGTYNTAATSGAAITRTITFNVNITDYWGTEEAKDTRCSLYCPGHAIASVSTSTDPGAPGGLGEGSGPNGTTANEFTCDVCGGTFKYTWGGGADLIPAVPPDANGEGGSDEVPAVTGDWSGGHTCTATVTYNCSTGTYALSGCTGVTEDKTLQSYNQHYQSTSHTWSCPGGATLSGSWTNDSLICEGYTSGMGCSSNDKTNCVHHQTLNYKFYITETVDKYAYRELTSAKIYALESATITSVDSNVVDSSAVGKSSSNTNLEAKIWRANGNYNGTNADPSSYNGRVWFTQFKDATYASGDGWTSSAPNANYWLGNCTINISVRADSSLGSTDNANRLDSCSVKKANGLSSGNFDPRSYDYISSSEYYKSHGATTGDWLSPTQALNEALHVVNAWQNANNSLYTVNIISDAVVVSGAGYGSQNVVAESYGVDGGINIFSCAFSSANQTIYRNHYNKYGSADSLYNVLAGNSLWDAYDNMGSLSDAETFYTGYTGIFTSDPDQAYGGSGEFGTSYIDALIGGAGSISAFSSNGEIWSAGDNRAVADGTAYKKKISATDTSGPGTTTVATSTEGSASGESFEGYYTTFDYPYVGNYTVYHTINGGNKSASAVGLNNSGVANLTSYDNGDGSTISYKTAMAINNLALVHTAENGEYTSPISVQLNYYLMLDFANRSKCSACIGASTVGVSGRNTTYMARYSNGVSEGVLNDIVIHDPVTVQYYNVIGNGFGDYDGTSGPATDESHDDMRADKVNVDNKDKNNYAVIGNSIHIWATDIGDFYDSTGSSDLNTSASRGVGCTYNGCDPYTGEINTSAKGYTNNMNCGRWTQARFVSFPFSVAYYNTSGVRMVMTAGRWIDLSDVRCNTTSGYGYCIQDGSKDNAAINASDGAFHYLSSLDSFKDDDDPFKYGLDYEFEILTSADESQYSQIYFGATAINGDGTDYSQKQSSNTSREDIENGKSLQADSSVIDYETIEIVGRIGNLALEDTGDFRYSSLFKAAETSWLIPGVVHDVNSQFPIKILSTANDILGNTRSNYSLTNYTAANFVAPSSSASTLSVTNYLFGGYHNLGKAGYYSLLPLSASLNPVDEFKTEQMRMGYSAYFDIETIGNYYGLNYTNTFDETTKKEVQSYNYGYESASDENNSSFVDTRKYVMNITPHYYLYDYSEGKFYTIDLYAGASGAYTKFYGGVDASNAVHTSESSLYIDLPNEADRRNVTTTEKNYTNTALAELGIDIAAYKAADYIGTAMGITLDANDLDYIGSAYEYDDQSSTSNVSGKPNQLNSGNVNNSMLNGEFKDYTGARGVDFIKQSQRWYFTFTLPSSTIATYAGSSSDKSLSQQDIINNNAKLKKEHPNAVIVAFADISVTGNVWTLKYNARFANNNNNISFNIFGDKKPDDWKSTYQNTITISESGIPVYQDDSKSVVVDTIDSTWAPLVVYDAYDTSNKDLDTYGTH
jgi:hypothetical protein